MDLLNTGKNSDFSHNFGPTPGLGFNNSESSIAKRLNNLSAVKMGLDEPNKKIDNLQDRKHSLNDIENILHQNTNQKQSEINILKE
jgi:hypothetical protein